MEVAQSCLLILSILFPRHPVHSPRRLFLQAVITLPEQVDAHVVQLCADAYGKAVKLLLPMLLRCFGSR
jgi:hypothetical protein